MLCQLYIHVQQSASNVFQKNLILQSALTVGIIGTKVGTKVQSTIHSAIGGDQANGRDNQISDGAPHQWDYINLGQARTSQIDK